MGAEHSAQSKDRRADSSYSDRSDMVSPQPASNEPDPPYISYTNRPIGESPQHGTPKLLQRAKSTGTDGSSGGSSSAKQTQRPKSIVVVRESGSLPQELEDNEELAHFRAIPQFLPLLRNSIGGASVVKDSEMLDRLDVKALEALCRKLQDWLAASSHTVAQEQNRLANRIKEVDATLHHLLNGLTERQKKYAKYAEEMSRVHDVSRTVKRCHVMLNESLELMETLNNLLPIEDRLEPFVWTTG